MKKEEHEKRFPIAKEDIGVFVIAIVCLAITLFLFFGPSPVQMLFHDKPPAPPAATQQAAPTPAPATSPGMMPAAAVPEAQEQPEKAEKPKP